MSLDLDRFWVRETWTDRFWIWETWASSRLGNLG